MKIGINTLPLKNKHKGRGIGNYTSNLIETLKADPTIQISEFTRMSDVKDVDIVHYPWFDLFFHSLPIQKSYPTVVTIHDVIPLLFPLDHPVGLRGKINFYLQKLALRSCKSILTDSFVSKKDIIKHLQIDDKKISVVHLACSPNFRVLNNDTRLLFIKRKYKLPDRYLLYVGDANWVKNLPFLIEGFNELIRNPGLKEVKLVLVGGVFLKDVENIDHPDLKSLKLVNKLIKQYGLETHIIKPGQIPEEDLVAFYNLASVYIQPSLYEGFGLPVLQAFACGTPVISSDKGSLPEIGGESAVYFNPNNLKQFTHIITEVMENKSIRNKLSRLGLTQATKFSWEKTAMQTKNVYEKVLSNE